VLSRRRTLLWAGGAVVVAATALVLAGGVFRSGGANPSAGVTVASTGGPTPAVAASEVEVPAGASGISNLLWRVACSGPGDCVAVGYYSAELPSKRLVHRAIGAVERNGVWGSATTLVAPTDADASKDEYATAVVCFTGGICDAYGDYGGASGSTESMVITEKNGVWSRARPLALPAAATVDHTPPAVSGVTCTSPGDCVAFLTYGTAVGGAVLISETHGVWRHVTKITLPGDADRASAALLTSLSCPAVASCTAVGSYTRRGGGSAPMRVGETDGVWGAAVAMTLPANHGTKGLFAGGTVKSIACPALGECTAVGLYQDAYSNERAFIETETHGIWRPAFAVTPPANAQRTGKGIPPSIGPALFGITCQSPGNCAAVGNYETDQFDGAAMIAIETDGHWARATQVALPQNSTTSPHGQVAWFLNVTAAGNSHYTAVGGYITTGNRGQAMATAFAAGSS
jgi:hypothetical protein